MTPVKPIDGTQFSLSPLAIHHPPSVLKQLAENLLKGTRYSKSSDLIPLVRYARQLGIDESLLPRIGYTLWRSNIYQPHEIQRLFGTSSEEIAARLKAIFDLKDRKTIESEYRLLYHFWKGINGQLPGFLQIVDHVSHFYPNEDQKALFYLWLIFPASSSLNPECIVDILNKIKVLYPNCTYLTQTEISTRILETAGSYYNNSDFDTWAWNAFLEVSAQQKEIDLHDAFPALKAFFYKLYPPLSVEQQHLVIHLLRRPILPNKENWDLRYEFLQLVNVHMQRFFHPDIFNNLKDLMRINFSVFLIDYWENFKRTITLEEITILQQTLHVFFRARHCDPEAIHIFQYLEHLFKIDINSTDFTYDPLVNHGLGNNEKEIRQLENCIHLNRAKWDSHTRDKSHPRNPLNKKRKIENTPIEYRVVSALFNMTNRIVNHDNPIELTLQTASIIYASCEESIRSLIRHKAVRFYLDFPTHCLSDSQLNDLAYKIITSFDFHVVQDTETIRLVIKKMSESLKFFHNGYDFSLKIRGLVSFWNIMAARDNIQQSIIPLLLQASLEQTCVLNSIFALLAPAAEVEPAEAIFDLIIARMKSEELTLLHRTELCTLFLHAPCFSASMRQAVIDHVLEYREETIYLDTFFLNFIIALTKRCESDMELRIAVCDVLYESFTQRFSLNIDRGYYGSKHFEPWTLQFIGVLPCAVTVDNFVNTVFKSLPSIQQYRLRCHMINTVVIQHLYELRIRMHHFCIDQLLGYYHFFKPIYERVYEEAGHNEKVRKQWKGFTKSLVNWHREVPKLKEYQRPELVNKIS